MTSLILDLGSAQQQGGPRKGVRKRKLIGSGFGDNVENLPKNSENLPKNTEISENRSIVKQRRKKPVESSFYVPYEPEGKNMTTWNLFIILALFME